MRIPMVFLSLLFPLAALASSDTVVTLALIHVSRNDATQSFSPALLRVSREERPATVSALARYPDFHPPLGVPLQTTSSFSMRLHPFTQRFTHHDGTDFAAPLFSPVFATEKGTVVEAKYDALAGNYIVLRHPGGWSSRYMHLNKMSVVPGQSVNRGSVIGFSGNTGRSTGPHLHFELAYRGVPVNSANLLVASHLGTFPSMEKTVVRAVQPSVPKIMLVTKIAGEEKVMVKFGRKTVYAGVNQTVFGLYRVLMENGRYRLKAVARMK